MFAKIGAPLSNEVTFHVEPKTVDTETLAPAMTREQAVDALLATVASMGYGLDDAKRVAEILVAAVRPPDFDLSHLDGGDTRLVEVCIGKDVAQVLQKFALATDPASGGITSIVLGSHFDCGAEDLAQGLRWFTQLKHLVAPVQSHGARHPRLGSMQGDGLRLEKITLYSTQGSKPFEGLKVTAPAGAEVIAEIRPHSTSQVVAWKATVQWVDEEDGAVGDLQTLAGLIYERQATELDVKRIPDRQREARDIDNNLKAKFPAVKGMPPLKDPWIACRHLSIQWMRKRAEYHKAKLLNPELRFSFEEFLTTRKIVANVKPDTELEYQAIKEPGAQRLFEVGNFGNWLAQECAAIDTKKATGEPRYFAVESRNHTLAVEVRFKPSDKAGGPGQYVVDVYDPNSTAMHERLVVNHPEQLRGRSLEAWISSSEMSTYFGDGEPRIGSITRWPADAETAEAAQSVKDGFLEHVSDATRQTPEFAQWALCEGRADILRDALALAAQAPRAHLVAVIGECAAAGPLAMGFGHLTAIEEFIKFVLGSNQLDSDDRAELLSHLIGFGLKEGQIETVRMCTQLISCAPDDILRPADKLRVLLASSEAMHDIGDTRTTELPDPDLPRRQHEAIDAHLQEALRAPGLSEAAKKQICASSNNGKTAARAALDGNNPGAAASMIKAIFKTGGDSRTLIWRLGSLGVSPAEVLLALRRSKSPDAELVALLEDVLNALPSGRRLVLAIGSPDFRSMQSQVRSLAECTRAGLLTPAQLENELSACAIGTNHWHSAASHGDRVAATLGTFADELLKIDPSILGAAAKARIFKGGDADTQPILRLMTDSSASCVKAYMEAGTQASPDSLTDEDLIAALQLPLAPGGKPVLSTWIGRQNQMWEMSELEEYMRVIMSGPRLSAEQIESVFARANVIPNSRLTVARLALSKGNVGIPFAMMMGILASEAQPQVKQAMLLRLGVTVREVLDALTRMAGKRGTSKLARLWAERFERMAKDNPMMQLPYVDKQPKSNVGAARLPAVRVR